MRCTSSADRGTPVGADNVKTDSCPVPLAAMPGIGTSSVIRGGVCEWCASSPTLPTSFRCSASSMPRIIPSVSLGPPSTAAPAPHAPAPRGPSSSSPSSSPSSSSSYGAAVLPAAAAPYD
ncbi:hypothetical protein EON68_01725, partial [archaeon]